MRLIVRALTCLVVFGLYQPPVVSAESVRAAVRFEVRFLTNMIDHHSMAVMMAELCPSRTVHGELNELCESIMVSQSSEVLAMQSWLEDWYGISYDPQMSRKDLRELSHLAAFSGSEFEIRFMLMMIDHHERAIHEAKRCVRRALHEDLLGLCESIIATQSEQIDQLEAWLCTWYGICFET